MVKDVPLEEENAPIDEVYHEAVISRHSVMGEDNELPQQLVEHPALQLGHRQAEMQVKKQTVQPSEPTQNQIKKQTALRQVKEQKELPMDQPAVTAAAQPAEQGAKQSTYPLVDHPDGNPFEPQAAKQPLEHGAKQTPHQPVDQEPGHPTERQSAKQRIKEGTPPGAEQPAKKLTDHRPERQVQEPIDQRRERYCGARVNSAAQRYLYHND